MKKLVPLKTHLIPGNAQRVFEGKIFDVYQWPQETYDGTTKTYEMVRRPDSVCVVAIRDGKLVVLHEQQPSWSAPKHGFPGGRRDPNEEPLDTAKRELLEETGMLFGDWRLINVTQFTSKIEWFLYVYLAQDFQEEHTVQHENGEKIKVKLMEFDKAKSYAESERRMTALKPFASMHDLLSAPEPHTQIVETID